MFLAFLCISFDVWKIFLFLNWFCSFTVNITDKKMFQISLNVGKFVSFLHLFSFWVLLFTFVRNIFFLELLQSIYKQPNIIGRIYFHRLQVLIIFITCIFYLDQKITANNSTLERRKQRKNNMYNYNWLIKLMKKKHPLI